MSDTHAAAAAPTTDPGLGERPLVARWRRRATADATWTAEPTAWLRIETSPEHPLRAVWRHPATGRVASSTDPSDPLALLEAIWASSRTTPMAGGGWIGRLHYGLGAWIEPRAAATPPAGPIIDLLRVESPKPVAALGHRGAYVVGPLRSASGREPYRRSVERVLAYLRAGDVFQVSLAHELRAGFEGDPRAAFLALAEAARPLHGAFIQTPMPETGRVESTLSITPELFLDYDAATGRVVTRPMKGTRPLRVHDAHDTERELRDAPKDTAELAMIIDLMRNDLGRVCAPGTIRVADERRIERHAEGATGGVLQATATIEGHLAPAHGLADLLRATFPPGSVTGAPKIRAMQIIDELEPFDRGLYCGATLWLGDDGRAELGVAIRTATIRGAPIDPSLPFGALRDAELVYPVGAGIVSDSQPEAEWRETLVKAGVLRAIGAEPPE